MTETIYVSVRDTIFSHQQIIDAYKALVESQQQTYNTIIIVVLAIATILVGLNIYFNI